MERKIASNKCQRIKRGIEKSRIVENLEQAALGLPSTDPNTYILGGELFIEPPPMNDPNKRDVKKPRSKHEETILLRFSFTLSYIDVQ